MRKDKVVYTLNTRENMPQLTIFSLTDGQHSCLYSWNLEDVDLQGTVGKPHKVTVTEEQLKQVQTCTKDNIEQILTNLLGKQL